MSSKSQLVFESTVAKSLVHKRAIAEVLITDSLQCDQRAFVLGSQWPREHHFYRPNQAPGNLTLLAEAMRQAAFVVCHEYLGVPLESSFLMDRLMVSMSEPAPCGGTGPTNVTIQLSVDSAAYAAGNLRALDIDARFEADGIDFGSGRGELRVVPRKVYDKIRGSRSLAAPSDRKPSACGKLIEAIDSEAVWKLEVPFRHSVFFDHPLDHVPGMLFLEAIRQAVHEVHGPGSELSSFDCSFAKFAEFEPEIEIHREVPDHYDVSGAVREWFSVRQSGSVLATAVVEVPVSSIHRILELAF
jgi:hypothetical protein